ncbi:hypothetical protein CJ195_16890 [Bacillus sp. UMB0899]|nr:hypothetical protein CJ195_16890 [Bacillus sp. UMB0899]
MSTYNKTELTSLSEVFLSILLTACIAIFCFKTYSTFPWFAFICLPIGIGLIVTCWKQRKHEWLLFRIGLLVNTFVWSIVFNWHSFF